MILSLLAVPLSEVLWSKPLWSKTSFGTKRGLLVPFFRTVSLTVRPSTPLCHTSTSLRGKLCPHEDFLPLVSFTFSVDFPIDFLFVRSVSLDVTVRLHTNRRPCSSSGRVDLDCFSRTSTVLIGPQSSMPRGSLYYSYDLKYLTLPYGELVPKRCHRDDCKTRSLEKHHLPSRRVTSPESS